MVLAVGRPLSQEELTEILADQLHGLQSVVVEVFICDVDVFLVVTLSAHCFNDRHCGRLNQLHLRYVLSHLLHLSADQFQQFYRLNGLLLSKGHKVDVGLNQSKFGHERTVDLHLNVEHFGEVLNDSV